MHYLNLVGDQQSAAWCLGIPEHLSVPRANSLHNVGALHVDGQQGANSVIGRINATSVQIQYNARNLRLKGFLTFASCLSLPIVVSDLERTTRLREQPSKGRSAPVQPLCQLIE